MHHGPRGSVYDLGGVVDRHGWEQGRIEEGPWSDLDESGWEYPDDDRAQSIEETNADEDRFTRGYKWGPRGLGGRGYDDDRYDDSSPMPDAGGGGQSNSRQDFGSARDHSQGQGTYGPAGSAGHARGWHGSGLGEVGRRRPRSASRGPKGYRRSDERIREDVCERMAGSGIDASDVEVEVKGGEVVLTGTITARSLKHRLENLADGVVGVTEVHNQLRVTSGG